MSFLIPDAFANTTASVAGQPATSGITSILFMVAIFAIFYFLILRPQQKRQKEQRDMISRLAKGDEVVTSGGLVGRIVDMDDSFLTLEIASNVTVKIQRFAVNTALPKGTLKI